METTTQHHNDQHDHTKTNDMGEKTETFNAKIANIEHQSEANEELRVAFSEEMSETEKQNYLQSEYPSFFLGRVLEAGASFGEIALQNRTRR